MTTTRSSRSPLEHARAVLLGLACGDALGAPVEFLRLKQIRVRYGPEGIREPPDPALYTDDTQMALYLVRALVQHPRADLQTLMKAISEQFLAWLHDPSTSSRAPGTTCLTAARNLERGIPWQQSGIVRSKGCGSAMRVAPVGYLYQHDPLRLREVADASGIVTHGHPAAVASCIGMAYLVKLALDGVPVGQWLEAVLAFVGHQSREFEGTLSKISACLGWGDEDTAMRYLGEGWVGEEALALALYCVKRHPNDYVAAVRRGANIDGDSDSVACMAGALSAARLGAEAIPAAWIERLEDREEIESLARQLAKAKGTL